MRAQQATRLEGGVSAPRAARAALRAQLEGRVDRGTLGDVELLVSELATNSVRHARADEQTTLVLELQLGERRLFVRWCDEGPGFGERPVEPHRDRSGGYGLVLVEQVASRWGVERGERFCVWFEVELVEDRAEAAFAVRGRNDPQRTP